MHGQLEGQLGSVDTCVCVDGCLRDEYGTHF